MDYNILVIVFWLCVDELLISCYFFCKIKQVLFLSFMHKHLKDYRLCSAWSSYLKTTEVNSKWFRQWYNLLEVYPGSSQNIQKPHNWAWELSSNEAMLSQDSTREIVCSVCFRLSVITSYKSPCHSATAAINFPLFLCFWIIP